jgi:subfamily B ATP-binding cassette protein HlyB/CyaB
MTDQMLTAPADVRQRTLSCLATLLRFHGLPMGADALSRELPGSDAITADDIVRLARQQELKARRTTSSYERLAAAPLPALAGATDGSFFILGRCNEDKVLVHRGIGGAAEVMDKAAFEAIWDGTLIFVTRRATLSEFGRQFGISWFMRAIYKYRNLLSQVLLASFFLQIFALISPLFFQVVVDKVLVHRGMTTLDVLLIGLVTVSIFETVLGALRTYVFSHTTNRIDVELGARLFRHLVALPLAYFGARRVGDSVARVRELENVRQFITGSSLTLVIDLFFTVVFIAVMAWYSWWLTVIVLV